MSSSPIVIALLGLLGLPGVTSIVVGLIRKASEVGGIDPRAIVWLVSAVVTAAVLVTAGGAGLPTFTGDPISFVGLWLGWLTANAKAAEAVYDILLARLLPTPA